jgi:hypothetical protein
MFIGRVEGWKDNVEDLHPSDGAVTDSWWNVDAMAGGDGLKLAIQFHLSPGLGFKDVIDLGVMIMVVKGGINLDVDSMQREGRVRDLSQPSPGPAAGASNRSDRGQVDHHPLCGCFVPHAKLSSPSSNIGGGGS